MKNLRKRRYARKLDGPRNYDSGNKSKRNDSVNITLDEFEALRLCDYEHLSQIEAAEEMDISRATVQRLLISGRSKLTGSILNNQSFHITNETNNIKLKGENKINMEEKKVIRIAFPTSDRQTVDGHFGHTKEFAIYQIKENHVENVEFIQAPPHEPGVLPRFLGSQNVDIIVTGGMGAMAINLFKSQNIDVILGAQGSLESNVNEYINGFLKSTGSACSHHHGDGHQHHGGSKC